MKNTKYDIVISPQSDRFLRELAKSPFVAGNTRKAVTEYLVNMFCAGKFHQLHALYEGGAVPLEKIGREGK